MKRYVADIYAAGNEDGATMRIKAGALVINLTLSNRARLELIEGLSTGHIGTAADLLITPLGLPKDIRELTEATLNARVVDIGPREKE